MEEWRITLQGRPINKFSIGEGDRITIGRGSESNVVIDNTAISRVHVALELKNGAYFVSDLKSLNGTMVNGKKIGKMVLVSKDDTINFGKFRLEYVAQGDDTQVTSSSYVSSMDIDEETVFVVNKSKDSKPAASPTPGKAEDGPSLVVMQGNARPSRVSLKGKSSIKIGKDQSCDIVIGGWFVAAAQCYVVRRDKKYYVAPQRSWASTSVNGLQIKDDRMLYPGDIIEIRNVKLQFR